MPSPKAQDDADVVLRRLRNDVNAFQSPEVRNALMNIDSPSRTRQQRNLTALEADLIAVRTLHTAAIEKINKLEHNVSVLHDKLEEERLDAENLSSSLKKVQHERDTYEARVSELERDHLSAAKSASENAALLSISSITVNQRVAQLESDLQHAGAVLKRAEAERDSAITSLDSQKREFKYQTEKYLDDIRAMSDKIEALEASNVEFLREREQTTADTESHFSVVASRADACAAEVAELRTECANRVEEVRSVRAECTAKGNEIRKLRREMQKNEQQLESVREMENKIERLEKEVAKGKNAMELVDALQEEKSMLRSLISSLSASGQPSDGLKILRDSALKKSISKQQKGVYESKGISSKELENITSKMVEYKKDIEDARREANEFRIGRDSAVAESERNKRLKEKAEEEIEILRKSGSAVQVEKASTARAKEYKRIIEELARVVRKKDEELVLVSNKATAPETLQRDLIRLLEAQLKEAEQEQEEGLGSKSSIASRLGIKEGRVGKTREGGGKRGRGRRR